VSRYIDEHRGRFGVEPICRTLDVSASAYYERAKGRRSRRQVEDERLTERIREVHAANYSAYGHRRIPALLAGASVLRLRDRCLFEMVVGWQLAPHMRTDLVLDALRMALHQRGPGADVALVHHSDRGSQYTSIDYTRALSDHGVLASVSSVGDAYDNALAESFVDSFKSRPTPRARHLDRPDPRLRHRAATLRGLLRGETPHARPMR
jgi:transposase InsO family protein